MAFNKEAPAYKKWEQAKGAVTKTRDLWLKYRTTDKVKADKYKDIYSKAKDLQNNYAEEVRAYSPPKQAVTPKNNVGLDSKAHSDAIISGQKKSGTNTKINKVSEVKINSGTVSTPAGSGNTSSGKSTNTTASGQKVPGTTTYNSIYGGDKNETSQDVNDTDYKKVEKNEVKFDSSNSSANYTKMNTLITKALAYKGNTDKAKASAIKTYGSLDKYSTQYKNKLTGYIKSGELTESESRELGKNFDSFMSTKMGYNTTNANIEGNLNNEDAGNGTINSGYRTETYTDSEGNIKTRRVKNDNIIINYDEITDRLSKSLFGNDTFKSNVNVYIDDLKDKLKKQKEVLEAQQSELSDMFKNQEADFQGQFGNLYTSIEKREEETKSMFGDIETGIKQKFEDIEKTMGEQKSGEKAGIEANLRAKGLSEGAISNALSKIDKKYEQSSRSAYASYTDNMKSLAGEYDKLASSINGTKNGLTQNKLAFSNALISRSKALTDAVAEFDTKAISILTQPISDMYKARVDKSADLESSTRSKQEKQERYKSATPEERLYILNDYRINMQGLGVKIENATPEIFKEASQFNNQAEALLYLTAKLNGNEALSGSSGNPKLDEFVKTIKSSSGETEDNKITDDAVDKGEFTESDKEDESQGDKEVDPKSEMRDGISYYNGRPDEGGGGPTFSLDNIPFQYANQINENIEIAIEGYYNRRGINGNTSLFGLSNPFKSESTAGFENDRDIKYMAEYSNKLESNYPGVVNYTRKKLSEAIEKVETAKEGLIDDIAKGTPLTKAQATEFINYRIAKSPKDILLNASKPSSYINLINIKASKKIPPEDIIK